MKWRACPQISRWRFCHRSALQIRAEKSLSTISITHLFLEDNLMKIGKAAVNGIIASLILSFGMLAGPAFAELRTTTAPDALCSNGEQATYAYFDDGKSNDWLVYIHGGGVATNTNQYRGRPEDI